jgi:hypothetical protein
VAGGAAGACAAGGIASFVAPGVALGIVGAAPLAGLVLARLALRTDAPGIASKSVE